MSPQFRYDEPDYTRLVPTIAELIAHQADPQARAAEISAAARAHAAEQSGDIWGRAVQGIGGSIANAITTATDPRRKIETAQLADIQQHQAGQHQLDSLMAPSGLQPGDQGPQQESYLDAQGLWDVPKLSAALAKGGIAHLAPELLKPAEAMNESILKHQDLQQKADQAQTILLGDMADGALKLNKVGMPMEGALDFVVQPTLATKRFAAQDYQQVKAKILALPPEQQQAALVRMMDAAAKLAGGKSLGKDAVEVDRYGRTIASNIVPDKPTEASIALDAAGGNAAKAMSILKPHAPGSPEEQYIQALASGDKPRASLLLKAMSDTASAKRDPEAVAQLKALRELSQQQAQQRLDDANTTSPKNQAKFEQEYRTVLARAMSSRSGGIGLEDGKVQQANHLLALMDQAFDPKSGAFNIPKVQYTELALGLARLLSPGGTVGVQLKNDLEQATAEGDLLKVATYITGKPFNGSTQDVFKMLRDSIERQGTVAEENRENEMRYLRGLAPTDLAEHRRLALEANSLGALRRSQILTNEKGERRLVVSTDGGKTWK